MRASGHVENNPAFENMEAKVKETCRRDCHGRLYHLQADAYQKYKRQTMELYKKPMFTKNLIDDAKQQGMTEATP